MTKNRIVKYAANTALLAVLAAAGIGVYQIGTYTPDKEIQEELQTDQSEDTEETPMVDADTSLVDAEISDTTGQNDTAEEKITQTLTDSADSSEKTSDSVSTNEVTTETANAANAVEDSMTDQEKVTDVSASALSAPKLSFSEDTLMEWPVHGTILLDYNMDQTVYFPTLDQYKLSPCDRSSGSGRCTGDRSSRWNGLFNRRRRTDGNNPDDGAWKRISGSLRTAQRPLCGGR